MNGLYDEFANLYEVDERPTNERRPSHKHLQSMLPADVEMPEILGKIDRVTALKQRDLPVVGKACSGDTSSGDDVVESKYLYPSSSKEEGALHRKLDRPNDSRVDKKTSYERNLRRYYEDSIQLQDQKRGYFSGKQASYDCYGSDRCERTPTEPAYEGSLYNSSGHGYQDSYYPTEPPPGAYPYSNDSQNVQYTSPEDKESLTIEISPGVFRPLRGAQETVSAIENGTYTVVSCLVCDIQLFCIEDCEMVVCPACKVVSPNTASFGTPRGVGLGLKV